MHFRFSRFSLTVWLLTGALLVSVGLNVYCLVPRPNALAAWVTDATEASTDWDDEDEDDEDDAAPLAPSRAMLADELRRARLQLSRCQAIHPAEDPNPKAAGSARPHPHG